jgi:hypothetical protein
LRSRSELPLMPFFRRHGAKGIANPYLLELFHPRSVIRQVVLLDLLNDVIRLRHEESLVAVSTRGWSVHRHGARERSTTDDLSRIFRLHHVLPPLLRVGRAETRVLARVHRHRQPLVDVARLPRCCNVKRFVNSGRTSFRQDEGENVLGDQGRLAQDVSRDGANLCCVRRSSTSSRPPSSTKGSSSRMDGSAGNGSGARHYIDPLPEDTSRELSYRRQSARPHVEDTATTLSLRCYRLSSSAFSTSSSPRGCSTGIRSCTSWASRTSL